MSRVVLVKLSKIELIDIIKEERQRINQLEKRMKNKVWRDFYRRR